MCSRDPNDLDPELRRRIQCAVRDYKHEFPEYPQPFITCTHRTNEQQAAVWAQGRTKPGVIVTWAEPGESAHNEMPSAAVDIAFKDSAAIADWSDQWFAQFARFAQRYGIAWGGNWTKARDLCHFEIPGWTIGGKHDPWPEMPA